MKKTPNKSPQSKGTIKAPNVNKWHKAGNFTLSYESMEKARFSMADIDDWHPSVGVRPDKKFR